MSAFLNYPAGHRFPPQRSSGHWVSMASGGAVSLMHPDPAAIRLADIAMALNRIARFNGAQATRGIWTVAQHSLAAELVMAGLTTDPMARLAALIHDFHEAMTGDIITPVAGIISNGGLIQIKAAQDVAICEALGIDHAWVLNFTDSVKQIDAALLWAEAGLFKGATERREMGLVTPHHTLADAALCAIRDVLDRTTDEAPKGFCFDIWPAEAEALLIERTRALIAELKPSRQTPHNPPEADAAYRGPE